MNITETKADPLLAKLLEWFREHDVALVAGPDGVFVYPATEVPDKPYSNTVILGGRIP